MKYLTTPLAGILVAATMAGCDNVGNTVDSSDDENTRVETEVTGVDTVGAETTYDVNRQVIEKVDTVGATTEYDIEKTVVKKTVKIDTLVQEVDGQTRVEMEEGDYEVVDKTVEEESVTEEVDVPNR